MSDQERHATGVEESDPDAASTALVGTLGVLVLVIVIVFVQGLYLRSTRAEFERKVVSEKPEELETVRADQLSKFTPRIVDPVRGTVAIPIEDAIAAMLRAPDPAAPVAAPPVAAAPAPAAPPAPGRMGRAK